MKRKLSISFIFMAVIMYLCAAIIPHHHHGEMMCMIMELCEDDHAYNDAHTHHPAEQDGDHTPFCIEKANFILSSSQKQTKCKVCESGCQTFHHSHLLPVFILLSDLLNMSGEEKTVTPPAGAYIFSYQPSDASQNHGLRAPPYPLA